TCRPRSRSSRAQPCRASGACVLRCRAAWPSWARVARRSGPGREPPREAEELRAFRLEAAEPGQPAVQVVAVALAPVVAERAQVWGQARGAVRRGGGPARRARWKSG